MLPKLNQAVSIAPLVFFRVIFGLMMFAESVGAVMIGFVERAYMTSPFNFTFFWADFLAPLPGQGMVYLYYFMAILSLMIMFGWKYKIATILFLVCFSYGFLLEKTHYINHHYLVILFAFLLTLVPANRFASLDARFNPGISIEKAPAWTVFIFPALMAIVYFYAAFAKINADWLNAMPLKLWLSYKTDFFLIGPLLKYELTAYLFAYGGILFDLLIVPLMLWKRSRTPAFILAGIFHLLNLLVFHIGIFPFLAMAVTAMFYPPHFFNPLIDRISKQKFSSSPAVAQVSRISFILAAIFIFIQLLLPLRPYMIEGNPSWTEEGHRFSWRMMLRSKQGGLTYYVYKEPDSDSRITEYPSDRIFDYKARKIVGRPDLIWQYAQYLADIYRAKGYENVKITANARVSLNGRPAQNLIDPEADLANEDWEYIKPNSWILPLKEEELTNE